MLPITDKLSVLHLLADEVLPLWFLSTDILLNRPCSGVHGEMVLDHLHGDTGLIRQFPREHIGICPEEGDKHAFLFLPQLYVAEPPKITGPRCSDLCC